MADIQTVGTWIGISGVGGLALWAVTWGIFKHYGEKWLEAKFGERLQDLKHAQEVELTNLRFKISALLDRRAKIHQHEFNSLPDAWAKINTAYWAALPVISPFQSYPDLSRMTGAQLAELLERSHLTANEKALVLASDDKTKKFATYRDWHRFHAARSKSQEAYAYTLEKAIFFDAEINDAFKQLHDMIWQALVEYEAFESSQVYPRPSEQQTLLRTAGETNLKALEELIRRRLWTDIEAA